MDIYYSFDPNKIRLTKVFVDLSKVIHGMSVGQLKPGRYKEELEKEEWGKEKAEGIY